jgi:hypothetical protein
MGKTNQNNLLYACAVTIASILLVVFLIAWEGSFQLSRVSATEIPLAEALNTNNIKVEEGKEILLWKTTRWCSVCASSKKAVMDIVGQYSDKIQFVEIDIDESPLFEGLLGNIDPGMFNLYTNAGTLITKIDFQNPEILRTVLAVSLEAN